MCWGLTSAGGKIGEVEADQIVLIQVEGKTHPIAVGKMEMNS